MIVLESSHIFLLEPKQITIKDLSRKVGWSHGRIVSLLKNAGFNLSCDGRNQILKENHIAYLAEIYVKSIRAYKKSLAKKFSTLTNIKLANARFFLKNFVSTEDYNNKYKNLSKPENNNSIKSRIPELIQKIVSVIFSNEPDVLFVELDDNKIRNFFYQLISGIENASLKELKSILYQVAISVKLIKIYIDCRSRIFYQILSHYYFSFSSEEDHTEEVFQRNRFSVNKFRLGEALENKFYYFKSHLKWEKKKRQALLII